MIWLSKSLFMTLKRPVSQSLVDCTSKDIDDDLAPLRSSDRRKLKQRVIETFALEAEAGDLFVPDPIFSFKFNTHLDEPGVKFTDLIYDPAYAKLGRVYFV
jgi:hypothetical protein